MISSKVVFNTASYMLTDRSRAFNALKCFMICVVLTQSAHRCENPNEAQLKCMFTNPKEICDCITITFIYEYPELYP